MAIKVFYDGSEVEKYCNYPNVVGVTTNISFLKKAGVKDYSAFAKSVIPLVGSNPISFQVFKDGLEEMEAQAREITSWGDNVYVKVPVVAPNGESLLPLIEKLANDNLRVNITCVYTKQQIDNIKSLNLKNPLIVSVFCGRIGDTGADPIDIMSYANNSFVDNDNIETLWAGCQRAKDILDAEKIGTDIITVPEDPLKKMDRVGIDLHDFSVKTSKDFFADGKEMYI